MINISFGGANIQRPGSYSVVDTAGMIPISTGDFKVLSVVGLPGDNNSVYPTKQVIQCAVQGNITKEGNATVIFSSAGLGTADRTISVPVLAADTAASVATKIATALSQDSIFSALATAVATDVNVAITAKAADTNDATMAISITNGTCEGLTPTKSTTTTRGVKGGVAYFNDPTEAKATIGSSESLDLMNIMWSTGASLIAYSPVALTATDADWQAAVDALQGEPIDAVVPASNAAAINNKVLAHCISMSTVLNRRERRCFIGHPTGVTVVKDLVALQLYNNGLALMATPSPYYIDSNGGKSLKGSEYLAAALAGMWASGNDQDPLTYQYVTVFAGFEKIYSGPEIITLLGAGIAPVEYVNKKGYRIVQGITTANGSSKDVTECELSVATCKVTMSKSIREFMEDKYVGKAGVAGIEITVYNDLITLIESFVKAGLASAYDKASVSVIKQNTEGGVVFKTQWKGTPTLPINDFLITSHFTL